MPASIEFETQIEAELPAVLIDPTQLNQLLLNLCINARDAMEGKGRLSFQLGWVESLATECASCCKRVEGDWVEL